jgi:hypothetical protein
MKKEIAVIGGGFVALNLVKQLAADGDFGITLSTGIPTIFFLRSCNANRKWEGDPA